MAKKKQWMKEAFGKNKGKLHRKLGIPEDETIPAEMLNEAAKKGGTIGKEANLAKTAKKINKKRKKK